jgi:hypothetical protein
LRLAHVTGFGTDGGGQVYVTSLDGTVARLDTV